MSKFRTSVHPLFAARRKPPNTMKIEKIIRNLFFHIFRGRNETVEQVKQSLEGWNPDLDTQRAHLPDKAQEMKIISAGANILEERIISVPLKKGQTPLLYLEEWCAANPQLMQNCIFRPQTNEIEIQ